MILKLTFLFTSLLAFCKSAFVDTLTKCPVDDESCQRKQIQDVLKQISKTGIPEFMIPPIDPIDVKNLEVPVLGLMDFSFEEGTVHGIKDCTADDFLVGYKEGHAMVNATCNIFIKGKYKFNGISPFLQTFIGNNIIKGDGNVKIKLDKLQLKIDVFYDIIRKSDGDIYINSLPEKIFYTYEIDNVNFDVENILMAEQDISSTVVGFFNANWKFVFSSFGKPFFDAASVFLKDILLKYFDNIPIKRFTDSDLSPYVKK